MKLNVDALAMLHYFLKKSSTSQAVNHRPVSLTCTACKLFSHIICKHIWFILMITKFLMIFNMALGQRDLVKLNNSNCLSAKQTKSSNQIRIAALDFLETFDTVTYDVILSKLKHYTDIYGYIHTIWQCISDFQLYKKQDTKCRS